MKKIAAFIALGCLAIYFYVFHLFSGREFVDDEYITDEGFYLRFDSVKCDVKQSVNVLLGLSPVRENKYDACQAVDMKLGVLRENNHQKDISYLWEVKNCVAGKVRQEAIAIELSDYFTGQQINEICANQDLYSIDLRDFRFIAISNYASAVPTSDPLGQQARLDSSIPSDKQGKEHIDINAVYSDQKMIVLIQKKLILLSDYDGPIDGIWNNDMEQRIRNIQNENLILFEDTKSLATLELLGLSTL